MVTLLLELLLPTISTLFEGVSVPIPTNIVLVSNNIIVVSLLPFADLKLRLYGTYVTNPNVFAPVPIYARSVPASAIEKPVPPAAEALSNQ